jgi:hypothetical protein
MLAAMQVAQNKWGSVKVDGSKEHLDMCAELAEKYRITLHFPKKYLEERKAEEEREQTQKEIRERIEAGKATVSDLRELRAEIARNCPNDNDPLLIKSVKIMLMIGNEEDNYPVTRHSGQQMLEILEKSIEQKDPQRAKTNSDSLAR